MRDARHTTRLPPGWPTSRLAEAGPRLHPTAGIPVNPDAGTGGGSVQAYANHGRWVVSCPDCAGAQLAHPADRRFLCVDCGNAGNKGRYRPVVWPSDYAKISEALDARLDSTLQNWAAPETLTALRNENKILAETGGLRG